MRILLEHRATAILAGEGKKLLLTHGYIYIHSLDEITHRNGNLVDKLSVANSYNLAEDVYFRRAVSTSYAIYTRQFVSISFLIRSILEIALDTTCLQSQMPLVACLSR